MRFVRKIVTSREKRRQKIIKAAAERFLSNGRDGVSMKDAAKAASVSRATLYTYFGNKDELFDAAVDSIVVSVRDRAKNTLCEVPESASLQEKLLMVFEAQQKSWSEVSELQRSIFFFEIWRRSQSMAKERGQMMPFHELVLEILKKEPALDYSFPNHDLPDLGALSSTIYLAASAILYSGTGASEKKELIRTFLSVFTKGLLTDRPSLKPIQHPAP
jgi:AcrR family transcriptional regulator